LRESGFYGLIGVLTLKLYMFGLLKKKKKTGGPACGRTGDFFKTSRKALFHNNKATKNKYF